MATPTTLSELLQHLCALLPSGISWALPPATRLWSTPRLTGSPAVSSAPLVEMIAAIARKDYEQRHERHERQALDIKKAKEEGKYKGRPADADLHKQVTELLKTGLGIRATARHADCSTTTVLRIRDKV